MQQPLKCVPTNTLMTKSELRVNLKKKKKKKKRCSCVQRGSTSTIATFSAAACDSYFVMVSGRAEGGTINCV